MAHTQLTSEQRYQIKALLQANQSPTKIAEIIGVDRSTIYRELKRNTGLRGYRPKQAHEKALNSQARKEQEANCARNMGTDRSKTTLGLESRTDHQLVQEARIRSGQS